MTRLPALLLAVLLGLLTACGVPQDDEPRTLDPAAAPFRAFQPDAAPPPQGDLQVELWFLRSDEPVPITREVELPGSPRQVLEQLFRGPTEAELAEGLSSAIPSSVGLRDVTVSEGIAVVTLDGLNEQVQVPAFAQIVATVDGLPNVVGVRFRTSAGDVQVPRGDGGLSAGAVTRNDYAVLLGLRPAPGATSSPPASG